MTRIYPIGTYQNGQSVAWNTYYKGTSDFYSSAAIDYGQLYVSVSKTILHYYKNTSNNVLFSVTIRVHMIYVPIQEDCIASSREMEKNWISFIVLSLTFNNTTWNPGQKKISICKLEEKSIQMYLHASVLYTIDKKMLKLNHK